MIRSLRIPALLLGTGLFFTTSCQESGSGDNGNQNNDTTQASAPATPAAPIAVADIPASPEFADARLAIAKVNAVPAGDSSKVSFDFSVKNYELKNQTADAASKNCNNSAQGQHIHFILDNKPYVALYEPKHEVTLANNTEHYLMCFLSRSYHEALKNKGAAVVYHFKIDEKGKLQKLADPKEPMIFYSRPKGDYLGKDTANLLLDFYVWNATLGTDYQVKADIANEKTGQSSSYTFTEWKPKFIQNLGTGNAKVTLTLMDKDGKPVNEAMNKITRDIRLAAQEPMK